MRLPPLIGLLALGLSACFTSDGADPAARRICDRMVECGGWGWPDAPTCADELFEDTEYEGACQGADAYRRCMRECVELECPQFKTCEADCWERAC